MNYLYRSNMIKRQFANIVLNNFIFGIIYKIRLLKSVFSLYLTKNL